MEEYKKKKQAHNSLIVLVSMATGALFCFFLLQSQETLFSRLAMGAAMGGSISTLFMLCENYLNGVFRKKSILLQLFVTTFYRTLIVVTAYALFTALFFNVSLFHNGILTNHYFMLTLLFSFGLSLSIESISILSRLLGQLTLVRLLSGRYTKPFEEERVIMFLDLAASTSIAESCGNTAFHSFINDFFYAITPAIVESGGEIYKYIGDEVIVTWKIKKGKCNGNFLHAFFLSQDAIEQQRDYFEMKYSTVPTFRAGIHAGTVVVGEMGDYKKEIAYLGDVVNTTARIIAEAGKQGTPLLLSVNAQDLLPHHCFSNYSFTSLGKITFRGKEQQTELVAVKRASSSSNT